MQAYGRNTFVWLGGDGDGGLLVTR